MGQAKQRGNKEERIKNTIGGVSVCVFTNDMPFYSEWHKKGKDIGAIFDFMAILRKNNVAIGCCYVRVFGKSGIIHTSTVTLTKESVKKQLIAELINDLFKLNRGILTPKVLIDYA